MVADWIRVARHRRSVFLAVMLLLASTLGWLGWRLLAQDEQLAGQRLADDRDVAADLVAAAFERRLSSVEQDLDHLIGPSGVGPAKPPEEGAAVVRLQHDAVRAWPQRRLLYVPDVSIESDLPVELFAVADDLEFGKGDFRAAIAALGAQLEAADAKVRAAALVRLARNHLKSDRPADAVRAYDELGRLGSIRVSGMPAAFAAHIGRLAAFERQKNEAKLASSSRGLLHDLHTGDWAVSYGTYQYLDREARRWLSEREALSPPNLVLAEAVAWLWDRWIAHDLASARGRTSLTLPSGSALIMWRCSPDACAAFAATTEHIERVWLADMKPVLSVRRARFTLLTPAGQPVIGSPSSSDRTAIRLSSTTALPWTIQASSVTDDRDRLTGRRRLLVAGMGVLVALILAGAWFIDQTVARELAVADLRSNFVSAVSHEFRTPLTTLCQLSELLMRDRVASETDRRQYYELLHTESQRLRRLVETLLNFGRLEAGRMQFRFEAVDVRALVSQSVDEFSRTEQAGSHRIELQSRADGASVSADRDLLRSTLWNLLENAVKYSPGCDTIWVNVMTKNAQVEIAVRDRGAGIPRDEQRRVFDTFVRGRAARASDVRGTGVGLAMARQIARAHGGDITVESEPGQGSTFRIVLPLTAEGAEDAEDGRAHTAASEKSTAASSASSAAERSST